VHRNIIPNYSQQDATFLEFIYFYRRSTCFRRFFRPSSGAHNCTYSFRYFRPLLPPVATMAVAAGSSIGIVGVIMWLYVQYALYCGCTTVAVCTVWTVLWVKYCGCMYSMHCIVGVLLWLYVQYGLYCGCNTVAVCTVWTVLWVQYCGCMCSIDCIVGVILWLYVQYALYCGCNTVAVCTV